MNILLSCLWTRFRIYVRPLLNYCGLLFQLVGLACPAMEIKYKCLINDYNQSMLTPRLFYEAKSVNNQKNKNIGKYTKILRLKGYLSLYSNNFSNNLTSHENPRSAKHIKCKAVFYRGIFVEQELNNN